MKANSKKPSEAAPPRMRALATLPVFLGIDGKRAVVAGGTAAAAWKAELLAAARAHVDIYAAQIDAEMAAVLARGATAGSLALHERAWETGDLLGAAIAVADAASDDEARTFRDAALASGVPFNVIDKPAYCQFQFGSIVNRSPVVVGISTEGAAPILGQAIRRRIETVLPPTLAAWGALAKEIRGSVSAELAPGHQRRAFWDWLAEKAFGTATPDHGRVGIANLIGTFAAGSAGGRVTLVGAGPGDAGLLTINAVRALQSADVILFDDLVSEDVLELARREAKRMLVGKRGGRRSCKQEDINEMMIKLAKQGKHVVRLKSGDPMIFGRAGEEIAELEAADIPVAVVPGITAAAAMASQLKTSLTHRDGAHSVRFVTGHARNGELPDDLDWQGLADARTTLTFYMGGRTAKDIALRLIEKGLPSSTPVVAVAGLTRPDEQRTAMTLDGLSRSGLSSRILDQPVLIGIGAVFARCVDERDETVTETGDTDAAPMPASVAR
jgi:uroporphyrin-III C-methyltransferase / precorrin-2 dehydrogenase / sirohydrochlorin ferrochelatase